MIRKSRYTLILLMVVIFTNGSAQNSQVLYFMNLPQNHFNNPALRPSNSLYIGLPVVSGINLNINNNFAGFSDVFKKGQSSDSVLTFLHSGNGVDDFLSKIRIKNSIEAETSVQLFGLGFSVGKDLYVFLDINDRIDGNVVLPGDLFKLALKGNESFVGSKNDFSTLRGDLKYYREFGFGFSKNITNKLRIGVKGKVLSGIAVASIDNRSLGITVNNDYSHTLGADFTMNFSAPVKANINSNNNIESIVIDDNKFKSTKGKSDFFMGKKNMGLGLDLGATYDITDKIVVSAAITDIGFIRWKRDLVNLNAESNFYFNGLDMRDVINGTKTFQKVGTEILDSLKKSLVVNQTHAPFTTFLPVGVSLAGSYSLTNSLSVGLLSYSRFIRNQVREALTLSGNFNLRNVFSASLGYTIENHRFDNLGLGLAFKPGMFQFYVISDRIPVMWNKIKVDDQTTIPMPANWNTISIRFGMNIALGNRVSKKNDKAMIQCEQIF